MATKREQKAAEEAKAEALRRQLDAQKREVVKKLAGIRMPHETIALVLVPPISPEELRLTYALELEVGPAMADVQIGEKLWGHFEKGNVTAAIFLSKVFLGWSEKGSGQTKDPVEQPEESAPPTKMPSAKTLTEKILPFRVRS